VIESKALSGIIFHASIGAHLLFTQNSSHQISAAITRASIKLCMTSGINAIVKLFNLLRSLALIKAEEECRVAIIHTRVQPPELGLKYLNALLAVGAPFFIAFLFMEFNEMTEAISVMHFIT